jgi:hypothetical protein
MSDHLGTSTKWTVMVYMAGDNNLADAGITDLAEMKKIGSNSSLKVIAQFDNGADKSTTRRYLLRQGTSLASDQVADLGTTDCGDPKVLLEFVSWSSVNIPPITTCW